MGEIDTMFMYNQVVIDPPGLSDWDTSKVSKMNRMFYQSSNARPDISDWDISSVIDWDSEIFDGIATPFDDIKWRVSCPSDKIRRPD